jgi:beta-lactamase regulating signal transducer with metallopeptidase domain
MLTFVLEAALRSFLMALTVWTSIRLLRVQAVIAQKVAWVMVLLAAGAMPLVMRSPVLALNRAIQIPVQIPVRNVQGAGLRNWLRDHLTSTKPAPQQVQISAAAPAHMSVYVPKPKPSAAHTLVAPQVMADLSDDGETAFTVETVSAPVIPAASVVKASPAAQTSSWNAARIRSLAIDAYLAVVALLLLRALAGLSIAFRVWRRAKPVADFAVNGHLHVRVSPDLATPVTIGSTILLPAGYAEWDKTKLRVVLAHEGSHVRQGDFYLQLLAAMHVAVFWFSPLGWWLQRKLSELGEALSDRAGLEQAKDPASYAQILLEFAAMPRTNPYAGALTGVAMARSSNLSGRIERILNDRRFRLEFLGGRRHAFLTALLVPAALVAVVACIRIVPSVHAAQTPVVAPTSGVATVAPVKQVEPVTQVEPVGQVEQAGKMALTPLEPVSKLDLAQEAAPVTPLVPPAPRAPAEPQSVLEAPEPPVTPDLDRPEAPPTPRHKHGTHIWINNGDDDNFAIVHENGDGTVHWNGEYNNDLGQLRDKLKLKGDYIWFERDGKSYVVTDPAMVAQAQQMFKGDPELERQMKVLEEKQKVWEKKMKELEPEMEKAKLPGPEFAEQMAKLNAQLAELQTDKFKKMTEQMNKEFSQEKIGELQEKMGDIQSQLGEIQGRIGERQGEIGEKQGAIGEKMGELGEQMGQIGEKQGQIAEEAARKLRSILDQAVRDGKAKPVE